MNDAFIYDHVRSPRGKGRATGALHEVTPVRLASQVLSALRQRNQFDPDSISDVGLGVVMPLGEQGADLARTAVLQAGYGDGVPGFQLNRFCTSGLDTVNMAAAAIMSGQASAGIGGGVESMSRVAIGSDGGACYTDPQVTQRFAYIPNGTCADLMAALGGFGRQDIDAYSVESQRRAAHARDHGYFAKSLTPVRDVLGQVLLDHDEAIRADTSMEDLAKLNPAFAAIGETGFDAVVLQRYPQLASIPHMHTSGSSSGIVDGACAMLIGDRAFGTRNGLKPRARIRGFMSIASEPNMGLGGPMPVTKKLLERLGMSIADIDLFEVNEAFAVVPMTYMREFNIPHERINVNGGAIALGHPLGATGAILLGTVLDELERRNLNTGLVTLCAAIGQATATVIERV
ncbi:acetyl-CoA C-acetyltransferase [Noviherbaspirillum sedimenti]|uniref:Acetyl-CoA C-acetyltransferase n=1 Tax=Noviherbaspirillum sedimenti TaxID=2320865 RepID=A0A3A3FYM2_9BURK|nr:acetyl-CoA C-acetyltransferase [Noviherbaspirillum sedimenti]RJG00824.1 acetyl-CoA C-acetyltransferase [Noviherbaspirillum sedimenti]